MPVRLRRATQLTLQGSVSPRSCTRNKLPVFVDGTLIALRPRALVAVDAARHSRPTRQNAQGAVLAPHSRTPYNVPCNAVSTACSAYGSSTRGAAGVHERRTRVLPRHVRNPSIHPMTHIVKHIPRLTRSTTQRHELLACVMSGRKNILRALDRVVDAPDSGIHGTAHGIDASHSSMNWHHTKL
jgi:hypothetical protein